MNLKQLHAEVSAYYAAHGDPAVVRKYARYFRKGYDAYGVPDEVLRPYRERFIAEHAGQLTVKTSLALGRLLMSSGKYEEAMTAVVLARHVLPQLSAASMAEFAHWLDHGVSNWATCDVLCGEVLSPLLLSGAVRTEDIAGWREAPSRWRRRALAVSVIPLAKRGAAVPELLSIVEPLLHDGERVVQQGLGWMLRECWKKDAPPVEQLLLKHKDSAPRLVYQYACEKMDKAAKERFKRGKPPAASAST